jgi:predicted transcriptional regulator of viral defense system
MESIKFIQELQKNNLKIFTLADVQKLLNTRNTNTAYKFIQRLIKKKVVQKLKNGLYCYNIESLDDFQIANFLYSPSYISVETALNFYGMLRQFPYTITSVTSKKSKKFVFNNKVFEYIHFAPKYFYGYTKVKNFLIANKEKALFDTLYLVSKGIRKISLDELDLSDLDRKIFYIYIEKCSFKPLKKIAEKIL